MTTMRGQQGQKSRRKGCRSRTARKGRDRTSRKGQLGQNSLAWTAKRVVRKVQTEEKMEDRTARTLHQGQHSPDGTALAGQP
jgi:hypothetical protein